MEFIDFKTIDEHGPQSYRAAFDLAAGEFERDEVASVGDASIQVNVQKGEFADEYVADGTVSSRPFQVLALRKPYPIPILRPFT
jgi:hypothetical protein